MYFKRDAVSNESIQGQTLECILASNKGATPQKKTQIDTDAPPDANLAGGNVKVDEWFRGWYGKY